MDELPIIQKTYDLITWYIPHINRMPRTHKYLLGDRLQDALVFARRWICVEILSKLDTPGATVQ